MGYVMKEEGRREKGERRRKKGAGRRTLMMRMERKIR